MRPGTRRAAGVVGAVSVVLLAAAGSAQAAPAKNDKPKGPDRPPAAAKGAKPTKAHGPGGQQKEPATQIVLVCSYECPDDGGPCLWVMRAETRVVPTPVAVAD